MAFSTILTLARHPFSSWMFFKFSDVNLGSDFDPFWENLTCKDFNDFRYLVLGPLQKQSLNFAYMLVCINRFLHLQDGFELRERAEICIKKVLDNSKWLWQALSTMLSANVRWVVQFLIAVSKINEIFAKKSTYSKKILIFCKQQAW